MEFACLDSLKCGAMQNRNKTNGNRYKIDKASYQIILFFLKSEQL